MYAKFEGEGPSKAFKVSLSDDFSEAYNWTEFENNTDGGVGVRISEIKVYGPAHQHTDHYGVTTTTTANDTLTWYCGAGCPSRAVDEANALKLTLSASSANYSGSAATITIGTQTEKTAWTGAGLTVPTTISYEKADGTSLSAAPTTVGSYAAKVSPVGVTTTAAKVSFTIEQAHGADTSKWAKDKTDHWRPCMRTDCTEKFNTASHQSSGPATDKAAEVCTVCGYELAPIIKIKSGANSVWTSGSNEPLVISSTAEFSTFIRADVDGKKLEQDRDYTAKAGSTVITLKPEYLKTLAPGTYKLDIVSEGGTASTNFTIKAPAPTPVPNIPQTGDNGHPLLWLMMLAASMFIVVTALRRKNA